MAHQLSLGAAIEIGPDNTLVFSFNAPVVVPVPRDFDVKIESSLEEQGVKPLAAPRIKFPGRSAITVALITIDRKFEQVRVTIPTKAGLVAALTEVKNQTNQSATWAKLEKLLSQLPDDGQVALLILSLDAIDMKPLKTIWKQIVKVLAEIDFDALGAELAELAKKNGESLPAPATED